MEDDGSGVWGNVGYLWQYVSGTQISTFTVRSERSL